MRKLYLAFLAVTSIGWHDMPAHASRPIETTPAAEKTLKHSITFLAEANSRPTPIDNEQNIIFLKIRINGQDAWAILDNACDHTVIDIAFAKSLGLRIGPIVGKLDLGAAQMDERVVDGTNIDIPGQVTLSGSVVAVDIQPFARLLGRPVQAIIGGDYLNRMAVLIQNSRKEMVLAKSGAITPRVKVAILPLNNGNEFSAKVNGKPVTLMVDMGANGTVRLSEEAWARVIPANAAVEQGTTAAVDGIARPSKSVSNATLEMGPVTVDRIGVSVSAKMPKSNDGLLGMAFLSKTDFILDVDQNKLFLIPIEEFSNIVGPTTPSQPAVKR